MSTNHADSSTNGQQGAPPVFNEQDWRRLENMVGNALLARSNFFQQMMDPRRNIDDECGYPQSETGFGFGSLNPEFYRMLYEREAIATRVVELMPKECWQQAPIVYEVEDATQVTDFELAWDNLGRQLRGENSYYQGDLGHPIWDYLKRAGIRSGIGHFGIILLGFDDGKSLDQPVDGVVQPAVTKNAQGQDITVNTNNGAVSVGTKEIEEYTIYTINKKTGYPEPSGKASYKDTNVEVPTLTENYKGFSKGGKQIKKGSFPKTTQPTGQAKTADGTSPFSSGLGTDAQYLGVQLSPTEYPSEEPATDQRRLLFMRVFDETLVQITQYEANANNPRFGQPLMYRVTLNDPREMHSGVGLPLATVRVHWSRVIHCSPNPGNSEVFSVPELRPVLNRVLDTRKIYSSSAEGYWRSCFSFLSWETHPQLGGDVEVDEAQFQDRVEQLMNGLQRTMLNKGMSMKSIAPQVIDPTGQIAVQLEAICIVKGCPVRVFKGSERGELASGQDDESWNERKMEWQNNTATPRYIVPLTNRLIQAGVLPVPTGKVVGQTGDKEEGQTDAKQDAPNAVDGEKTKGNGSGTSNQPPKPNSKRPAFPPSTNRANDRTFDGSSRRWDNPHHEYIRNANGTPIGARVQDDDGNGYSIEWPDLEALSKKDKATIALTKVQALQAYAQGGVEAIIPPMQFLTSIMGMDDEEAQDIIDSATEAHDNQETMTMPPQIAGQPAAPAPGTAADQQAKQQAAQAKAQAAALAKSQPGQPGGPPINPIKVKPGEKLVHPGSVKPPPPPA